MKNFATLPGVYQMLDAKGQILYVGKAKNLKKRLASYFRNNLIAPKITTLMQRVVKIQTIITRTENEALLLENNLIKKHRPRYNIFFKDDKSYPYLYLSEHDYPSMLYYRGAKGKKGHYFGPYPNAGAVKDTLNLIQKIFKLRQCTDNFFKSRTRPCLQYQIKRCSAPCVQYINQDNYAHDVRYAMLLLKGKGQQIIGELTAKMEEVSAAQDYEKAAVLRDQIMHIRKIQQEQCIHKEGGDVDVVVLIERAGLFCIELLFIRDGRMLGNQSYFPKVPVNSTSEEVLSAFLEQYYLNPARISMFPRKIIINKKLEDRAWLEQAFIELTKSKITLVNQVRAQNKQWQKMAELNAHYQLNRRITDKQHIAERFKALQEILGLANLPERIECFDVSHIQGEATIASCVLFDSQGPCKQNYRRFNIANITKGDDYAAMKQALTRRYTRLKRNDASLPDIIVIDGGKGQVAEALAVLEELQITQITLIGIAKGPERKPGLETLFIGKHKVPLRLAAHSPALRLLQYVRDEAHRFAITAHRNKRIKSQFSSKLEKIPGIGPKRRHDLLCYFGGMQALQQATVEELIKVPGINKTLAEAIKDIL